MQESTTSTETESQEDSAAFWSSNRFYLIAFSYSCGPMVPRLSSPWLVKTRVGFLMLLPIQLILMFIVTVPCVFMELALGQYSSKGLVKVWDLCPILRGIGYCSCITFVIFQMANAFLCNSYLLFAALSFGSEATWKSCNQSWNQINCYTIETNFTRRYECNQQFSEEFCENMVWESSIEQFYYYRVLNAGEHSASIINYELLLFTLMTAIIGFLANYSGPKSTEKFLIVLIVIPTIELGLLILLPLLNYKVGYTGLMYLFTENEPERLENVNIWISMIKLVSSDAGLGFGGYITLGTRLSFRKPLLFRSVLMSFLIFSITTLHTLAIQNYLSIAMSMHKLHKDEFLDLNKRLRMPEAVFFLKTTPAYWTSLWFTSKYLLGLRSMIATVCLTTEIIYNSFPRLRKRHTLVAFICCVVIFLGVAVFSMAAIGYFLFKVLDEIIIEVGLVFINTAKVIGVVYCYGITNFLNDLHFMLGIRLSLHWKIFYVINPLLFGTVLIRNLKRYYDGSRMHQDALWKTIFQNTYLWVNMAIILFYSCYYIGRNIARKHYKFIEPSKSWGPTDPTLRKSREMFTAHSLTKEYVYRQARFGTSGHDY